MENLERQFYEFLTDDRAYPKSEIQVEASLGDRIHVDIAIVDSRRNEILALVEVKATNSRQVVRSAVGQILQFRRELGKPHIPLYVVFPTVAGGARFQICQVLPDGETKDVYLDEFPSYENLLSGDKAGKKLSNSRAVKSTVDTFHFTCVCLAIVGAAILFMDIADILVLTVKQLILAAASAGLLVLPFAAKFKLLGVEFERHQPGGADHEKR